MTQMTKEQQKALAVLLKNLPNFHSFTHNCYRINKTGALLPTNFIAASYEPISKTSIPRENFWSWNQSNAKIIVKAGQQTTITFRKISTKKDVNCSANAPSCKIWLYEVASLWGLPQYFLWCERGASPSMLSSSSNVKGIKTEIGTIFPDQLSTESLSFLRPFVDDELAAEL